MVAHVLLLPRCWACAAVFADICAVLLPLCCCCCNAAPKLLPCCRCRVAIAWLMLMLYCCCHIAVLLPLLHCCQCRAAFCVLLLPLLNRFRLATVMSLPCCNRFCTVAPICCFCLAADVLLLPFLYAAVTATMLLPIFIQLLLWCHICLLMPLPLHYLCVWD